MSKLYYLLNLGMDNRLEDLAKQYDIPAYKVKQTYEDRKKLIDYCYGDGLKGRESRILARAYKGTVNYYKALQE